jgi:hypothetical protein
VAFTVVASPARDIVTLNTDNNAGTPPGTGPGSSGDLRYAIANSQGIDGERFGRVIIDGSSLYRIFWLETGPILLLQNLQMQNGLAQGGNSGGGSGAGGGCGGGGAAAGSAIILNGGGSITIVNSGASGAHVQTGASGGGTATGGTSDQTPVYSFAGKVNGTIVNGPVPNALSSSMPQANARKR